MAVEAHIVQLPHNAGTESFAQSRQSFRFFLHLHAAKLASLAETNDEGHWNRSAPHPPLMAAAIEHRLQPHMRTAPPHVKSAHAFGAIYFVRGKAEQVNTHRFHVEGQFAGGLDRVCMKEHATLLTQLADSCNR